MPSNEDSWHQPKVPSGNRIIVSTTSEVPGHQIARCLCIVMGEDVAEGGIPDFGIAQSRMEESARRIGCDAVVCVRFVSSTASAGGEHNARTRTQVVCYGTAVIIEDEQVDRGGY